jgi:hypothetical protein
MSVVGRNLPLMSRRRSTSPSPFGGMLLIFLIIGIIIKFIWWILGIATVIGLYYLVRAIVRDDLARREVLARRRAEIVARADQQHQWVMQGDERGIYGPDGAKLMRDIRS